MGKTASLFLAVLFMFGTGYAWSATEQVGRADSLSGKVAVERQGKEEALKVGDPLFLKDKIRTGADSAAEIVLADESRVKLAANTTLEITEYLYNPAEKTRQGLLSMVSGKARFAVQDLQDFRDKRFRVQTQTAVVGSRDTDFIVVHEPSPLKDAMCREGLVEAFCLENAIVAFSREFPDKPVLLTANMISQVCGRALPSPPRFATPAERARLTTGVDRIGRLNPAPGVKSRDSAESPDEPLKRVGPDNSGKRDGTRRGREGGEDSEGSRDSERKRGILGDDPFSSTFMPSTTTTTRPRSTTPTTRPTTTTTKIPITTTTMIPTTTTTMMPTTTTTMPTTTTTIRPTTTTTRPTLPPPPPPPGVGRRK